MKVDELFHSLHTNHGDLDDAGFAHVANVSSISNPEGFQFSPGLKLRKATETEAKSIRALLSAGGAGGTLFPFRNPYEFSDRRIEAPDGGKVEVYHDALSPVDWRYHVISFHSQPVMLDFVDSTIVTRKRLVIGHTVQRGRSLGLSIAGTGPAADALSKELALSDSHFIEVTSEDADDMKSAAELISTVAPNNATIDQALRSFRALDGVPKSSPLRFLGLISILESLVTHKPEPKDPYDSLTRQVRQKMLLIGRRSRFPIPYELFSGVNPGTVWNKIYDYRSSVAHGATPDFSSGLSCLKDPKTALQFIESATVTAMRHCLEEPQLMVDLREC